jgi:hypothetical protein
MAGFDMKYLDIACGKSPHFLVESLRNPDGIYVGVDKNPVRCTPEMFYWTSKASMLQQAVHEKNKSKRPRTKGILEAGNNLTIALCLIDVDPDEQEEFIRLNEGTREKGFYDIDRQIAGMSSRYPRYRNAFSAIVSDVLYDDDHIVKAFSKAFPRVEDKVVDRKSVLHSGFYASNQIEKILFGRFPGYKISDVLRMPFPVESKAMIKDALSRVYLATGDMFNLPFKDSQFDYVRDSGTSCLQDKTAMSEAQRVLKNGRIVKVDTTGIDTELG